MLFALRCSLVILLGLCSAKEAHLSRLDKAQWQQWAGSCGVSVPMRHNDADQPKNENRTATWMLRVDNSDTGYECGAALITPLHILTLAKCFENTKQKLITSTSVVTAQHHVFIPTDDRDGEFYKSETINFRIVHYVVPIVYTKVGEKVPGALVIAQLSEAVNMEHVSPICIPFPNTAFPAHHEFESVEHPADKPVDRLRRFKIEYLHMFDDCIQDACTPIMENGRAYNRQRGNPLWFVMEPDLETLMALTKDLQAQSALINDVLCGESPKTAPALFLTNSFTVAVFITNYWKRQSWEWGPRKLYRIRQLCSYTESMSCSPPRFDGADYAHNKDEFPYPKNKFNYYYDSSVGKRYIKVHNMVAPHCDRESCTDLEIVILELYQPIDISQSYIRPVCLPSSTSDVPKELMTLVDEETKKDDLVNRKVAMRNVTATGEKELVLDGAFIESKDFGAPVVAFDDHGRAILHGIVVGNKEIDGKNKNIALKIQALNSFICLHTGICPDGYDNFKDEELYSPFFSNVEGGVEFALETMNSKEYSTKIFNDPQSMEKELIRIGSVKDHNSLRLLSDKENEENNHECGKLYPHNRMNYGTTITVSDHLWPVIIEESVMEYETRGETRMKRVWKLVCTGSFIFRRHAITAAHCVKESTFNKPYDMRVSYGANCYEPMCDDTNPLHAYVRHIIYSVPGFKPDYSIPLVDIAILELNDDISPSARNGILCMPRKVEDDKIEDNRVTLYGAGISPDQARVAGLMQNFTVDITKEGEIFVNSEMNHLLVTRREYTLAMPSNDVGDSGGPVVRYRNGDGRAILYGVISSMNNMAGTPKTYAVLNNLVIRAFICRVTGVCTENKKELLKMDMPKPMIDGIEVCARFD